MAKKKSRKAQGSSIDRPAAEQLALASVKHAVEPSWQLSKGASKKGVYDPAAKLRKRKKPKR